MAYTKTNSTLISRPGYGVRQDLGLGDVWGTVKSGASGALDFFGAGIKAQGAQEALQQQLALQAQAQANAQPQGGGGIPTTALLIGGVAVVGVLVFMMRKK
jgi:hypothetical protein